MNRNTDLDVLRGLMLVLMTLTHLPTMAARWASQPFGYVSNAEGFVFLSAYLVGRIYSRNSAGGIRTLAAPLWRRAGKIYVYHFATLIFALTAAAAIAVYADRPALANLLGYYLQQPWLATLQGLLLVYRPPLLDILPMYIVFMLLTPLLLAHGARRGWTAIFTASGLIWLAAQFGLRAWLHGHFNVGSPWPLPPLRHLGAFNLFAWQLLWISGIWLGQRHLRDPGLFAKLPNTATWFFLVLVLGFVAARYLLGGYPAHSSAWLLKSISKWNLGPLRLLDFTALTIFCARYGAAIARRVPTAYLAQLGRSSLPVFSAHVIACLTALGLVRNDGAKLSPVLQLLAVVLTFALMFAVATNDQRKRRATTLAGPRPGAQT